MIPLEVLSLRQLRAFEAAARLESVGAAARAVNLSQPGVTQSLHALEARLDARLFDRRRSGCYATKFAAILLPRVQCFFEHVRAALGELIVTNPVMSRQTLDMTHKITKPQIRSLLAIYESESFEAAARRLGISQPSLHRSAKELERELHRGLYQRSARGMSTNARGSELARRLQVVCSEILRAERGRLPAQIVGRVHFAVRPGGPNLDHVTRFKMKEERRPPAVG